MTDIVERLREHAATSSYLTECRPRGLIYEAADEIERLRAEIVLLEATGAEASDEIERLRAALRRIANGDFCAQHMSNPPICVRAYEARLVLGERHHD